MWVHCSCVGDLNKRGHTHRSWRCALFCCSQSCQRHMISKSSEKSLQSFLLTGKFFQTLKQPFNQLLHPQSAFMLVSFLSIVKSFSILLFVFYITDSLFVCWLDVDLEQLLTMELKELSDGEMTIALSSVTTDKDVSVNAFIPFSLVSVN